MSYVGRVATAVQGMAKGMKITLRHYLRFSEVVTQQYPENRATLKMPPRFRGKIHLLRDPEKDAFRCTACGLCVKACPNNSLRSARKDPDEQVPARGYYHRHARFRSVRRLQVLGAGDGQRVRERRARPARAHPAAGHPRRRAAAGPGGAMNLLRTMLVTRENAHSTSLLSLAGEAPAR
jgi:ferredoxin